MPISYRIYQIDAFTRERFAGNPAGVVPNADGLTETQMAALARELNNSETAFIFKPTADDHDVHVRFFTPTVEVPVCGHATIAAHFVRALEGTGTGTTRQLTGAGVLTIETEIGDVSPPRVWMRQRPAIFERPLTAKIRERLISALGVTSTDLSEGPVQIVSTGHSKVLIPLRRRGTLAQLAPSLEALRTLSAEIGCNGYYPFVLGDSEGEADASARMFAPAIGIAEDPVTGNAAGPLAAYALHHGVGDAPINDTVTMRVAQGAEIGRPGRVLAIAARRQEGDIAVKIGGDAVVAFKTQIIM